MSVGVRTGNGVTTKAKPDAPANTLWSLADQGVVSAGNFLTTVLVARAFPTGDYGLFAIVFGTMLVLHTVHGGILTYPLSVRGAASDALGLRRLTTCCLLLTAVLAIPLWPVLVVLLAVLHHLSLLPWVLAAAVIWQMQETTRRGLMAHTRHREALIGDTATYGGQVILILLASTSGTLGLQRVFACMAVAASVGLVLHLIVLRPLSADPQKALGILKPFWSVGRWALLANLAHAVTMQAFLWLLARTDIRQAGIFQALLNPLAFTNPVAFSLGNVVVPVVAQVRTQTHASGRHLLGKYLLQGLLLLLPYYVLLLTFPAHTLRLFYGPHSGYTAYPVALRLLVLGFLASYGAHVLGSFLFGAEDSAGVSRAQLVSSICAALLGLPLAAAFGVNGAAVGFVIVHCVRGLALWRRFEAVFNTTVNRRMEVRSASSSEILET